VAAGRAAWKASQPEIDIHRLVFIDETGASTKMARLYGRSPYGQRCVAAIPHGHWKTTTFVGALRATGIKAPMVLDSPMDGPRRSRPTRRRSSCQPSGPATSR